MHSLIRPLFDMYLRTLFWWAVPIFLMISGYLLLDPKKEIGLQKIYAYVLRMLSVLAVFGFSFCLMESAVSGGIDRPIAVLGESMLHLFEAKNWDHMWYVYALVGLYLMLPVLRPFVRDADRESMRFILTALFVLAIAIPMLNQLFHIEITSFVPTEKYGFCIFYFVSGYALRRYGLGKKTALRLLAVGAIGYVVSVTVGYLGDYDIKTGNTSIFVAFYSIGLFALAMDSALLEKLSQNSLIQSISRCSFGIYLLHMLFLNLLDKGLHVNPNMLPIGIGELVFFAASFICAWLTSAVLRKIPFFRTML